MTKRGPRRLITNSTKVGEHGSSSWYLELECGHTYNAVRKPRPGDDRMSCKKCVNLGTVVPKTLVQVFAEEAELEASSYMSDLKSRAKIASVFKVDMDSVQMMAGTATVFLDAQQVARLLSS